MFGILPHETMLKAESDYRRESLTSAFGRFRGARSRRPAPVRRPSRTTVAVARPAFHH